MSLHSQLAFDKCRAISNQLGANHKDHKGIPPPIPCHPPHQLQARHSETLTGFSQPTQCDEEDSASLQAALDRHSAISNHFGVVHAKCKLVDLARCALGQGTGVHENVLNSGHLELG